MAVNAIEHLGQLDERIQLIYQLTHRFVVLSHVHDDDWTVHVGLVGEGRWWKGRWGNDDVLALAGSKASAKNIEAFADRLVETVVGGLLFISNWGPESGREIKLTFDPTGKRPLHIPLVELTAQATAEFAAEQLFAIGLFAQNHGCHLIPTGFTSSSDIAPVKNIATSSSQLHTPRKAVHKRPRDPSPGPSSKSVLDARDEQIKALQAQLAQERTAKKDAEMQAIKELESDAGLSKVAPMAKPQKKARKVKAMEFASDEE